MATLNPVGATMIQDSMDQGSGVWTRPTCVQRQILAWLQSCGSDGLSEFSSTHSSVSSAPRSASPLHTPIFDSSSPPHLDPQMAGEQALVSQRGGREEPIVEDGDALTGSSIDADECERSEVSALCSMGSEDTKSSVQVASVSSVAPVVNSSAFHLDAVFVEANSVTESVGSELQYKCAGCLQYHQSVASLQAHLTQGWREGYSCGVFYRTLLSMHQRRGQQHREPSPQGSRAPSSSQAGIHTAQGRAGRKCRAEEQESLCPDYAQQQSPHCGPAELPAASQNESGLSDAGSSVSSVGLLVNSTAPHLHAAFVKAISVKERVGNERQYKCAGCLRYHQSLASLQDHLGQGLIEGYSCGVFYRTIYLMYQQHSTHQSRGQEHTGRFQLFRRQIHALFLRFRGSLRKLLLRFQWSLSRLFSHLAGLVNLTSSGGHQ